MIDPTKLAYTETHEWVQLDGDVATIGISRFAVDQLTDLIMIDLSRAKVGGQVQAGKPFGEVESVKAVADLYAPIGGEILEVNQAVVADVQLLAEDPYDKGWLLKLRVAAANTALDGLMDHDTYQKKVAESPH